jgi:hypothetical protein
VADLSDGTFKGMSVSTRRYGGDPASVPGFSLVTLIADSTATMEVQRAGRPDTANSGKRGFKGKAAPAIPGSPPSVGLYEQVLMFNSPSREPLTINLIGPGLGKDPTIILARHGRDTVAFTSSFFPNWTETAVVDANGRIQSLDAAATTVKAVTRRASNLDFDAVAKSWAAYETAHGPAGATSPADTVRATIGAADIEIDYSRPMKRGRRIFGSNIVPFDVVWRTGANAATMFTTSADLMFGNTVIPAGKYTLWSLPTANGAKLIINSETGQWGTDYNAAKDFARLDLTQTMLKTPVEEFTFGIVPQGNAGVLKFSWDDREFSIPFRVK